MIYSAFELYVPKAKAIKRSSYPLWYNKQLCNLNNVRNRHYKRLCASRKLNKDSNSSLFDKVNAEFELQKKETYNKYVHELAMNSKKNPGKFWKFINEKRKSNTLPCRINLEDKVGSTDCEKAELRERTDDGFSDAHITPEIVEMALRSMDFSKGQEPDLIPPHISAGMCFKLSRAISRDLWKFYGKGDIYKSGKKSEITNYRGAAVTPNLAKVFERIVYNQLRMIINPQISKQQHGFVKSRNIETNLMTFCTYVHTSFEQGAQVDVFYSDV